MDMHAIRNPQRCSEQERPGFDETVAAETRLHFAEELKELSCNQENIRRVEDSLSEKALMMNLRAATTAVEKRLVSTDDGQWRKNIDLFGNLFVCHRPAADGTEYTIVEHFPATNMNEIWVRGWSPLEVLRAFVEDQQRALRMHAEDVIAQIREYLAEKYPEHKGQPVNDSFCLPA
jgi:hypothetical protein